MRGKQFVIISLCIMMIMSLVVLKCNDNSQATSWTTEIVDMDITQVGWDTSIAIDSMDYPHISYYDETNDKIKYASWTGIQWINETIDNTVSVGGYTSLALDSNDFPHVSYDDEGGDDLRYSYWNGSAWARQTPDSAGLLAHYTSIAVDSSDRPHISYFDWGVSDLKYAWWNGTAWNISAIDAPSNSGHYSSIALDSNDRPHISYTDGLDAVKYAMWDGNTWNIETVDSQGFVSYTSIALDSNDNPHIAYRGDNNLTYAKKIGTWSITRIEYQGGSPSLALDALDNPHISYYNSIFNDLKYAFNTIGTWNTETVDSVGIVGQYSSIALDSSGRPYISYFNNNGPIGDLKYANWTGSEWNVITIDYGNIEVGRYASLALDKNGDPHISYLEDTYINLRYANKTGGSWSWGSITSGGLYYTSIALDANDRPHISFFRGFLEYLQYTFWNGTAWIVQTVDSSNSVGKYSSLALDSNDYPAISYFDEWNSNLKYANWTGSSWTKTTVDWSGLVGGYTSLAIDNNDYAHISYYRDADGDLMYANWTGSDWNIVTIDSLGDVGKFTSIDLDSNDIPHVSYYDVTNKALKHAWWDGSSWQNETADSSADVGQYSSIAIDTWDMPHISYYDATNGDLKYASWVGIWANEVVDSVGNVGRFTSLKLDSSNNPYIAYNDVTNFELKYAKGMLGPSPPGAPQGLAAMPDDSQVSLSWTSPLFDGGAPINNYNIHRGFSPGSETFLVTVGNVLNYLDSSVTNGITYYYKVSAVNGVGEGPLSNEASATPATVPGAPTGLTAIAGDSFVNITWNSPVSDGGSPITNYSIYRGTTSGGETFLAKIGMMLYYNDTSVTNGITYFYKVSANNSVGEGPFSNEVSGTPNAGPTVPSSPQNLHASAGDSYVNLTWNPPASDGGSSIANYRIYRGMTPGGEVFLANLGIVLHYNDTSVANGITYYYKVSASNAIGEGPLSNEASGTPNALTEPVNQPPECTISSPANSASVSGMVTISGTSSDSDGSVQKVEVKIDDGSWVKVNGKTTWSFEWNTSAVSDGQHEIHARAYDGEDYSEETDVTVFVNNTGGVEEEKTIFEQAWFWILIAVILVLLIFALIYLWKRKNRKKKEPKEEKGEEETTSLESDSDISEFKDI